MEAPRLSSQSLLSGGSFGAGVNAAPPKSPRTPNRPHIVRRLGFRRSSAATLIAAVTVVVGVACAVLYVTSRSASSRRDSGTPRCRDSRTRPLIANTWPWTNATAAGYKVLTSGPPSEATAMNAVVAGCHRCEVEQCDGTVGFGGSPDSTGETTLDAMVMDGRTFRVGAVGMLRRVKNAVGVAKAVMDYSAETLLVADGATAFAKMVGFQEESLETPTSADMYKQWVQHKCQPNYYRNFGNDTTACPPYARPGPVPTGAAFLNRTPPPANPHISYNNHDTIGMIAIDMNGDISVGTSSNGANHKVAGRVGDASVAGAGGYADNGGGACVATGDGDVSLPFVPCAMAVQSMRLGMDPTAACADQIKRVANLYPAVQLALLCANSTGNLGAAAVGWTFTYSYASPDTNGKPVTVQVPPLKLLPPSPSPVPSWAPVPVSTP